MKIGVTVGRFQVDEPHEGHLSLLDTAQAENDVLVIILGSGPLPTSNRKPLPFETRKSILNRAYPNALVIEVHDDPDDHSWSMSLDYTLELLLDIHFQDEEREITMYHSRDSFAKYYTGLYDLKYVEEADIGKSGTLHRKHIAKRPLGTQDFARGVIWANENRFPTVYGAVDAMIFRTDQHDDILLITKAGRKGYMFPGGFTDPSSDSDEEDTAREVDEECSIAVEASELTYIGSKNVEDWRYASEPDCIRSRMYMGYAVFSSEDPIAGDDAETAQWVNFKTLQINDMNPCHRPLLTKLREKVL